MEGTLIAHCGAEKIGRADLVRLPVPETTGTFKPIPHYEVVNALIETLGFRKITNGAEMEQGCRWIDFSVSQPFDFERAGDGDRTRDVQLGNMSAVCLSKTSLFNALTKSDGIAPELEKWADLLC